jgi:hypothetical protein
VSSFTPQELDTIGASDELQVSSRRVNGTMRPFVTIWGVRDGDDLYIRSAHGATNGWFRRAMASGHGQNRAGGIVKRVAFQPVGDEATNERIDAAYHRKYDRYGAKIVGTVVGPNVREVTVRLLPE